jgi:hypothetical protein
MPGDGLVEGVEALVAFGGQAFDFEGADGDVPAGVALVGGGHREEAAYPLGSGLAQFGVAQGVDVLVEVGAQGAVRAGELTVGHGLCLGGHGGRSRRGDGDHRGQGSATASRSTDEVPSRSFALTVQEVDRLGRNLLEGPIVLNGLFQEGIAAVESTERSLILDIALALAVDRRRDIIRDR